MGEALVRFYQQKLKKEWKIAFFSTFIVSLLIHLYKFANTLPNHDSVYNYYSEQQALGSGRWALSTVSAISSYFDLPWINGLISCIFIALTVVVIVALFRLKNPVLIGLIGSLLAASPSVTETFFFNFTADSYFIAMFLATLAVYLSRMEEKRIIFPILGGLCVCVSCGIYQAYVSFTLILTACYFIDILLQGTQSGKSCLKWLLRQVLVYVGALAVYYGIWKLSMLVCGVAPNDYQGISQVGNINAHLIVGGMINAARAVLRYFMQWNVFEYGLTLYSMINLLFLPVLALGFVIACIKGGIYKKKWALVLLVLSCLVVIPFAGMWHFASDDVGYRAMMLTSLVLLFMMCAILYERWAKPVLKELVCLLLAVIVFKNAIMANVSYYYMNVCYERTYAEGIEIMMEIHDLQDEYEVEKIAVLGNRLGDVQWGFFDEEDGSITPAGELFMLSSLIETNLLIDHEHTVLFLRQSFGLEMEGATGEEMSVLSQNPAVQEMGCWPAEDSMTVIDGILVLKLSE